MKVFMMTDIEGVAGVVSFADQAYPDGKYYEEAKKLLTAEVNAAVDAMVEVGIEDVLVFDGHGPGAISFPDLHEAAKLLHGRPLGSSEVRNAAIQEYDVAMIIGQHAMAGTATGNLNHTQNSRAIDYIKLNGKTIGEITQCALQYGALGLPLVFVSGDEAACREAEDIVPGITTAVVKTGLSRNSAISVSAFESHRRIRDGVKSALAKQADTPIQPLVWKSPYVLEKRYFQTDRADADKLADGWERIDSQTVSCRSDNILNIIYR